MKTKLTKVLLSLACISLMACSGGKYGSGVPVKYIPLLDESFAWAGDNAPQLKKALDDTPRAEREGMAFLIAWMPRGDLRTISADLLVDNVRYAYEARNRFAWAKSVPDSIFLNYVLPYANVDETRENWRPGFFETFGPKVAAASNIYEAIEAVNKGIDKTVRVAYNTRREKTNQSPSESMRQGMASCTGLAILLVDAFRSVGIPARFAGTTAWHDDRGNHSWVEVWADGQWHFTEFYYVRLDDYWFLPDAGKADPENRRYAIYAVSYSQTGDWFPMVWNRESTDVPGVNVTQRYVDLYGERIRQYEEAGTHVAVRFMMFRKESGDRESGDRVEANVDVFDGRGQVDGGRTAGVTADMNDVLTFFLKKNETYYFRYTDALGNAREVKVEVGGEPVTVMGFME